MDTEKVTIKNQRLSAIYDITQKGMENHKKEFKIPPPSYYAVLWVEEKNRWIIASILQGKYTPDYFQNLVDMLSFIVYFVDGSTNFSFLALIETLDHDIDFFADYNLYDYAKWIRQYIHEMTVGHVLMEFGVELPMMKIARTLVLWLYQYEQSEIGKEFQNAPLE